MGLLAAGALVVSAGPRPGLRPSAHMPDARGSRRATARPLGNRRAWNLLASQHRVGRITPDLGYLRLIGDLLLGRVARSSHSAREEVLRHDTSI